MTPQACETYDTVIIGARCAGAFTALHLARGGQRVLVVDRDPPGSDTLSTHAMMRLGVMLLDEAGVLPRLKASGAVPVQETVFHYGDTVVPVEIKPRGGADGLYAPRRAVLDRVLVDTARTDGATFRFNTGFRDVLYDSEGRVCGVILQSNDGAMQSVRCKMVIGADGRHSSVAKAVGAKTLRKGQNRTATLYTYVDAPALRGYHWHFGAGMMAGLIPTHAGKACAFIGLAPAKLRDMTGQDPYGLIRDGFARCGAPTRILHSTPSEAIRRFAGAFGHMRQSWGAGWALVGDAGYFKDPATAHGITDALRDARSLAQAVLSGTPSALQQYQSRRDAHSSEFFELTDRIAGLDWTMSELQQLHVDLHRVMRSEQDAVMGMPSREVA